MQPELADLMWSATPGANAEGDIRDIVGHMSTHVTETVYPSHRPDIRGGATVMDTVFGNDEAEEA